MALFSLWAGCRRESPAGESGPQARSSEALFAQRRAELAARLAADIRDSRVIEAIGAIPRHEFVPEAYRAKSYEDTALPIAEGQNISTPRVVARMTQLLQLEGDEKVLEVGTGSGYQAAILARLAAEVYTMEIRPPLKAAAEERLADLRRRGLFRCQTLQVIHGDGSRGYPAAAPFDAIVVTAASSEVPEELVRQLKPGGRLVIPIGSRIQDLRLVVKKSDGSYDSRNVEILRFAPLEEGKK